MDGPPNVPTFSKRTEGDGKVGVKTPAAAAAARTPKKNKLSVVIKKKKIGIKVKPKRGGPVVTATATAHGIPTRKAGAGAAIGKNSNRRRLNVGLVGGGRGLPSSTNTTIRTSVDSDDETNKKNDTVDEFDAIYGNGSGDGDEGSLQQLLPNDTLMAIQSIQQDAQGLHIPCNGGNSTIPITIQAVLESQIYNRFNTNHASTVFQEIRNLFTTKQIKALPCLGIGSSNTNSTTSSGSSTNTVAGSYHHLHQHRKRIALVTTRDYISGVWMAHENFLSNKVSPTTKGTSATTASSRPIHQRPMTNETYHQITTWFTTHLSKSWTQPSVISKHDLEFEWQNIIVNNTNVEITEEEATSTLSSSNNQRIIVTLAHALYYLQVQLQVLMRDGSSLSSSTAASVNDNEIYNLWLPQWGIVLKAWNEAQQQLLSQIKRSRGGIAKSIGSSSSSIAAPGRRKATTGEISEQNLLHTNRHANISTKFLLDDLFSQGIIRRIERPFGTFNQLE